MPQESCLLCGEVVCEGSEGSCHAGDAVCRCFCICVILCTSHSESASEVEAATAAAGSTALNQCGKPLLVEGLLHLFGNTQIRMEACRLA